MSWLTDMAAAVRALPDFLAERLRSYALSLHMPYDLMGDGSYAWCRTCRKPWPCDPFVRLDDNRPPYRLPR